LAPVIRLSSASPERTLVMVGPTPTPAITRLISRRRPASTNVTTLPDSPARAVRPAVHIVLGVGGRADVDHEIEVVDV
jgi:hypothetical protein